MTWRRLITAGAMRQQRPRLREVKREARQFGVAVPGGVEHVGPRARTLLETGNWLLITDCSNAFNTMKRMAVLAEVSNCVPALTLLVAKFYGTRTIVQDQLTCFFGWIPGRPERSLLQRCPARGPHGSDNVLPGIATGDEAFQREVLREKE